MMCLETYWLTLAWLGLQWFVAGAALTAGIAASGHLLGWWSP